MSARVPVTVQVGLSSPTATGATVCPGGTATLTAGGLPAGGTYKWYAGASTTTALQNSTSSTFVTPPLTATTTYYVSISKGGCESLRTAVTATIATIPPAPSTYGGSSCGPGSITLGAVTAVSPPTNLTHRWYDQNGNLISGPVSQTSPTTGVATTYTATFYQPTTTYYVATYNTSTG